MKKLTQQEKNAYLNKVIIGDSSQPTQRLLRFLNKAEKVLSVTNVAQFKTRIGRLLSISSQLSQPFVVGDYYVSPTEGGLYNVQYNHRGIGLLSADQVAKRISQDYNLINNPA